MANKNALGSTKVRKSIVEYVNIYEVTENELGLLESGGQSTLMMDIAISSLSIAITCIVALVTSSFTNEIAKYSFLFVSIVCFVSGLILLIISLKSKKSVSNTIKTIKARLNEEE